MSNSDWAMKARAQLMNSPDGRELKGHLKQQAVGNLQAAAEEERRKARARALKLKKKGGSK